ncbi:uncharacterized protein LOC126679539 isoform X2 [Mercurialis annua]|uniref:uncharacterized protein LOC126679539 isoform X2 n=1 Tax=Mercurialis annua TaxID=3986 RepID=UPI00215E1C29|nr:uncharacterized protein LOC126679539 isoform X2 [Mercurialis annua]
MNFGEFFKPKNGALPMVGQVMSATRGATDAFSGASRHVNDALRKIGAKRIETGIGCGVGFGYGFGVGLAVKPGVVQKLQLSLMEAMMKMMTKLGMTPNLLNGEGGLPMLTQSAMNTMGGPLVQSPLKSITQMTPQFPGQTSQGTHGLGNMSPNSSYGKSTLTSSVADTPFGSRTEKVLSSFLQSPILKEDDTNLNEVAGRLRSENNLLQMVLKHQKVIEGLMEENEKLREILVEDLKISPSKLQSSYSSRTKSACDDCFECRRRRRKSR